MDFFKIITTVLINFLYCRSAWSSSLNFPSRIGAISNELKHDNILKKFFVELNRVYVRNYQPRQITVVGASDDDLRQTEPFFETYPYVICKESAKCGYSQRFNRGSFVIVFLEDLSEKAFRKNLQVLSCCSESKVLFVSNRMIKTDKVMTIFDLAYDHNIAYSEIAQFGNNSVKIYSDYLKKDCSIEARLVSIWKPGVKLNNIKVWVTRLHDMNGCPVTVSSLIFTPKMMIEERENGSLRIVGGREGHLLLALAEKYNFTIALRYPSMDDQLKYSRKVSIMNDVSSGISEIGIGRLRPTNDLNHTIIASLSYDEECLTWGVPRIVKLSHEIVAIEFSSQVWMCVGLVFFVSCAIGYLQRNVISSIISWEKRIDKQSNVEFFKMILDVVAVHLGNPANYIWSSIGGRLIFVSYIYYAMVMTTAYKSSLASILTTDESTPQIIDAQGIIDANLIVGGSLYDYNILKDQVNDSELNTKLLERFVVNNNDSKTWHQMMFDKNYAYLSRRSSLDYDRQKILRTQESLTYDVLDGCVLAYPTVMVYQLKSFLRKPLDKVIVRLTESGILRHWDIEGFDADKILKRKNAELYFQERGGHKFRNIFFLYGVCVGISISAFFVELIFPKLMIIPNRKRRETE